VFSNWRYHIGVRQWRRTRSACKVQPECAHAKSRLCPVCRL